MRFGGRDLKLRRPVGEESFFPKEYRAAEGKAAWEGCGLSVASLGRDCGQRAALQYSASGVTGYACLRGM